VHNSKFPGIGFWHAWLLKSLHFLSGQALENQKALKDNFKNRKQKTQPKICRKTTVKTREKKYLRMQLLSVVQKRLK
jgi:hypothetical protein